MNSLTKAFAIAMLLAAAAPAPAHFTWLSIDQQGHALLFFSESASQRDYRTPDCLRHAKVIATSSGEDQQLNLELIADEGYQGMKSQSPVGHDAQLTTSIQYGIYHGTLLQYYARRSPLRDETPSLKAAQPDFDAIPFRTSLGVGVLVVWQGQPLADAEVSLKVPGGNDVTTKTNAGGVAEFNDAPHGELAFLIGNSDNSSGELDGKPYQSKTHYLSLTTLSEAPPQQSAGPPLPDLPTAVASFGGAVCDGWLYVYSGHTGEEHAHSRENLSPHFCRLKLDGGESWEELTLPQPLQGVPLVAYQGKLYRVGGLTHRNAAEEDEDMHSTASAACYNPATREWTDLPDLPSARSSHDAVVIGDHLYVAGGWTLAGSSPGEWLTTALRLDLSDPEAKWEAIKQPFERRAVATAQLNGKLVVIGGMQRDQGVTSKVNAYDPTTREWSDLPDLPGRMSGFGCSAWNLRGRLLVSGMQGAVYALAPDAEEWTKVTKAADPRFFHRLLPAGADEILHVAGASTETGHTANIERIKLPE